MLGIKLGRISIEPEGVSAGRVHARLLSLQRSAVYSLAGHAAEEVMLEIPFIPQLWDFDGGDVRDALLILQSQTGRPISADDPEFAAAWERACRAVRVASRRIRAVARRLLEVRVVEGEDIVRKVVEGRGTAWYMRALLAAHGRERESRRNSSRVTK